MSCTDDTLKCVRCRVEQFCYDFLDGKETHLLSIIQTCNEDWPAGRIDVAPDTIYKTIKSMLESIFLERMNHGRVLAAFGMLYDIHQEHRSKHWYHCSMVVDPMLCVLSAHNFDLEAFKKYFVHKPSLCSVI